MISIFLRIIGYAFYVPRVRFLRTLSTLFAYPKYAFCILRVRFLRTQLYLKEYPQTLRAQFAARSQPLPALAAAHRTVRPCFAEETALAVRRAA
jgi:hypothetical protein